MIKKISPFALAGLSLVSCNNKNENANTEKPNVILILTDDQGYGDLGFHGNKMIKTPVIDSLANASVRFTNFYVSPVSAPTRSSLMTGKYALRVGVYDTYNGGSMLRSTETTLAELLHDAGYKTGVFGKWHLGDNYPMRPVDQGFDESLVHQGGGIGQPGDHWDNFSRPDSSYFNPTLWHNGEPVKTQGYCTDVFTDNAIRFVENNKDNPFFVYLAYNAPHTPLQVPGEYLEMYKDVDVSDYPNFGYPDEMHEKDMESARKVYAMVTNIDDNLRRLLGKLMEMNELDNTVIIFMTDNGPEQIRFKGGLRRWKGSVYEGGIRVPFFISWKGHLPENREINTDAAHIDVLPTLCDLLSIDIPAGLNLDGKSLMPLVNGADVAWKDRPLFFEWQRGYSQPYQNMAVQKKNFKLVSHGEYYEIDSGLELYDMENDPYELKDISKEHPEIVKELKADLEQWYDEVVTNNKNLEHPRISIGSAKENPVLFNRNDMHGVKKGPWSSDEVAGYWDVHVESDGLYTARLKYVNNFKLKGANFVRIGTVQRKMPNRDTTINEVVLPPFRLKKGDAMLEAWYEAWGRFYWPFSVEIEKVGE